MSTHPRGPDHDASARGSQESRIAGLATTLAQVTMVVDLSGGRLAQTAGGAHVPTVFAGGYATQEENNVRASKLKSVFP
jgi:hypothetical protein